MGLNAVPLFAALTEKMKWHQQRQGILAENVANAETPGYRANDLKAFSFKEHLASSGMAGMRLAGTGPHHIVATGASTRSFSAGGSAEYEVTPDGNGVVLEDEMMKVTANQMDYQTITTLYTRSLKLIRTALGRQA